jgi:hypothetical protein
MPVINTLHPKDLLFFTALIVSCVGCSSEGNTTNISNGNDPVINGTQSATKYCKPLPTPEGNIIRVSPQQASTLQSIVSNAPQGSVILLEDGEYMLNGDQLWIDTPEIVLRSASGNPKSVIINGNYTTTEIITLAASNITIAELTLKKASTHPIHVIPSNDSDTSGSFIYRVNIEDPAEQAIKINPVNGKYADNGIIACSQITLTDDGRTQVNPAITGCYTGGIDAHDASNWIIRDNIIEGFWCANGLSEHAIHFWTGSKGTIVERNILKNNARGIGFGLLGKGIARTYKVDSCPISDSVYIGHYNGIIKNNFISASAQDLFNSTNGFDCGICLASACQATVVHNTVASSGNIFATIDSRFIGSYEYEIHNNWLSHNIIERGESSGTVSHNITYGDLSIFVDKENGDLHLTSTSTSAINSGLKLESGIADFDIDGESRGANPDIGADEKN